MKARGLGQECGSALIWAYSRVAQPPAPATWAGQLSAAGCPVISAPGLCPPDAKLSHGYDDPKSPTWPDVPWGHRRGQN